ncbi:hypothetical protein LCGC14_0609830 [marine sediment metagenome]|uniref:Uncharacterized protein n=1 Tax=marine sediment metagenome TaxID=412755 RepID=A0A0F9RS67_9ZZZZ
MGALQGPVPSGQTVFSSSATKFHEFGAEFRDAFGRRFRYVGAGGTALVVGDLIQSAAEVADHQVRVPVAAAIGNKTITIAIGGTAITADQYAEGFAIIETTPGFGYTYPIRSHPTADASASAVVFTLQPGWEIVIALTTTSRVTVVANPCQDVIQSPTTESGAIVGVAQFIIAANEYGWVGIKGAFGVLMDGNVAVGGALARSNGTAGAAEVGDGILQPIGSMLETGVTGQLSVAFLNI